MHISRLSNSNRYAILKSCKDSMGYGFTANFAGAVPPPMVAVSAINCGYGHRREVSCGDAEWWVLESLGIELGTACPAHCQVHPAWRIRRRHCSRLQKSISACDTSR